MADSEPAIYAIDDACVPTAAFDGDDLSYWGTSTDVLAVPEWDSRLTEGSDYAPAYGGGQGDTTNGSADADDDTQLDSAFDLVPDPAFSKYQPTYYPYSEQLAANEKRIDWNRTSGYLYVGVQQARSLKGLNKKDQTSDPYCSVYLEGATIKKPKVEKTKVVDKNLNPKFYSEFLFAVPENNNGYRLAIDVFHRAGLKHKQIGSVKIPVTELRERFAQGVWHPVQAGSGEIQVFCCFTRMPLRGAHMPNKKGVVYQKELPSVRFTTERSSYYAGELVKGVCYYSVRGKPKALHSLKIGVRGYIWSHSSHEEHYTDSNGHTQTRTVHHYERHNIFHRKVYVLGANKNKKKKITLQIPEGAYSYPFELWLPPVLPPSFYLDTGKCGGRIHYQFEAMVKTAKALDRNKKEKLPIRILQRYSPPISGVQEKKLKFLFNKGKDPIKLKAWMPSQELFPGMKTKVSMEIDNQSSKKLSSGHIVLWGYIWAHAKGYSRASSWTAVKLQMKKLNILPISKGEKKECAIDFEIPSDLSPTLNVRNVQMTYGITVSFRYGIKNARIKIPIVVQPGVPGYLQQFPASYVNGTCSKTKVELDIHDTGEAYYPWWSFISTKALSGK